MAPPHPSGKEGLEGVIILVRRCTAPPRKNGHELHQESRPEPRTRSGIFSFGVIRHRLMGDCGVLFRSYPFPAQRRKAVTCVWYTTPPLPLAKNKRHPQYMPAPLQPSQSIVKSRLTEKNQYVHASHFTLVPRAVQKRSHPAIDIENSA